MSISTESIIQLFERQDSAKLADAGGIQAFADYFQTSLENGIPESESANNYEERRAKHGVNVLPDPPKESWCKMFIDCFEDLMLRILLLCALVSLVLTLIWPEGERSNMLQYIDIISIFVAVLLVSVVQTQTNYSQQKQFLEISKLKNVFPINVIRGGQEIQIENAELLAGDILSLKNGDRVAADGLYIKGHQLKVNNSQETGESCAIEVSEKSPFVLGGGAVESGDAHVLVCAVGQNSQSGVTMMTIQDIEQEQEKSPLEKKLDKVAVMLTYIGLAGAVLTFIVLLGFWIKDAVHNWNNKRINDLIQRFMIGVTIFICAVPEGLPLAVTLSLGFSMKKMMKDQNFVRHLNACETMGGATTICSDKTGTLTQNKMTVVKYCMDGQVFDGTPSLPENIKNDLCEGIAVNSSAYYSPGENGEEGHYVGSSSECALLQMIERLGVDYRQVRSANPVVVLHEFNSARKRMSSIIAKGNGFRVYAKGAPDFVLENCTRYVKADGTVAELDDTARGVFFEHLGQFADNALRTMLIAYNDLDGPLQDEWRDPANVEKNLIAIGFVGIQDPLRPEVRKAIEDCRTARVVVRMVTGDYIKTAKAIARDCGILNEAEGDIAIEGKEFSTKTKLELLDIAPRLRVMARSSPRDKYRLVSLLMEMGEVVAVTGDGSNDSPALKKANVGLAMGKCGTELAKMASDIVILDDNFNSIVSALKWGRCVYDNVRSFLQFQLTVNFAAMIIAFIGSIALQESPLKTIQLLWVNLIMDSLGALALATRGPSEALLKRAPYGESDALISPVLTRNIIGQCVYQVAVLCVILFGKKWFSFATESGLEPNSTESSTLVFNTFVYMQVFNLINSRVAGQDMSVFDGLFSNTYFNIIFVCIGGLQALLVELGKDAFDTTHMTWKAWLLSLGFGAGSLVIGAILRCIKMKDNVTENLNKLRAQRRNEMMTKYQGMSFEQQWSIDYDPKKEEKEKEDAEKKSTLKSPLIDEESLQSIPVSSQ